MRPTPARASSVKFSTNLKGARFRAAGIAGQREFDIIWRQLTRNLEAAKRTFADEGSSEEEMRSQYRARSPERRVRPGLVIGEIGETNKLNVTQDEMRTALMEQARRYPGQERVVYDYYQKNPNALVELRAPIFEDKVGRPDRVSRPSPPRRRCRWRSCSNPRSRMACCSLRCTTMPTSMLMSMANTIMITSMIMTTGKCHHRPRP